MRMCESFNVGLLFAYFLYAPQINAQISERDDCTETSLFESIEETNITREELLAIMDEKFSVEVSRESKCEPQDSGSANGTAGGSAGGAGGGGGGSTNVTAAPNQLAANQKSISVNESLETTASTLVIEGGSDSSNGAEQQALLAADADAQTILNLKRRIQVEEDPQIREFLETQIEQLENN